jgi:hypothetical protein
MSTKIDIKNFVFPYPIAQLDFKPGITTEDIAKSLGISEKELFLQLEKSGILELPRKIDYFKYIPITNSSGILNLSLLIMFLVRVRDRKSLKYYEFVDAPRLKEIEELSKQLKAMDKEYDFWDEEFAIDNC